MTKPKPLTDWQQKLPLSLPRHIRRNIEGAEGGCWLWTRSRSRDGYGWASLNDRTHQAHRLVYTLIRGAIGSGLVLDHLCRVRHCVNPDHLQPVTPAVNLLRSDLTPAGQTKCLKCGGPLVHNGRQRRCRPCQRKASASYARRKRRESRCA